MDLFNPFAFNSTEHENRLTWSFLTMLKYDMYLQKYIYDMVTTQLPQLPELHNTWEPAHISTQTSNISESTQQLVSVLLTDKIIQDNINVEWMQRNAIYDGVIEYSNGLTLIIENKLDHENVWEEQLSPSVTALSETSRENVLLHNIAICLVWPDVLEAVLKYSDSEIATFGNRTIARDFLSFTEEFHPSLTPYRTYILCGNNESALWRRTVRLVDTVAIDSGLEVHNRYEDTLTRPDSIATQIQIEIITNPNNNTWKLRINLWPASTSPQADQFREALNRAEFLILDEGEWTITPNLNFSFRGRKLHWATTNWDSETYLNYFFNGGRHYGRKNLQALRQLLDSWSKNGLIGHDDRLEIERNIQNRQFLDVNPEFWLYSELDSDTVIDLESQGHLEAYLIELLAVPLATWGENL